MPLCSPSTENVSLADGGLLSARVLAAHSPIGNVVGFAAARRRAIWNQTSPQLRVFRFAGSWFRRGVMASTGSSLVDRAGLGPRRPCHRARITARRGRAKPRSPSAPVPPASHRARPAGQQSRPVRTGPRLTLRLWVQPSRMACCSGLVSAGALFGNSPPPWCSAASRQRRAMRSKSPGRLISVVFTLRVNASARG